MSVCKQRETSAIFAHPRGRDRRRPDAHECASIDSSAVGDGWIDG
jgi:hypothetical protein